MGRVSAPTTTEPRVVTLPFLAIVASGLCFFFGMGMVMPVLPRFIEGDLGGSSFIVGVVVGSFAFSAVLARPMAGRLGNRFGRRALMVAGSICAAVSLALYAAAQTPFELGLFRLLTGVGDGLFFTGSATLVADMAPPERRGQALSYFSITAYLGQGLGPTLGEAIASGPGRRWTFVVGGMLTAVGAALSLRAPNLRPPASVTQQRQPLLNRKALGPGSVLGLGLMGFTVFSVYVPLYVKTLGMSGAKFVFLVYAGVVMTVRLVGARLPDALGVSRTGTIATGSIAVGLAVTAAWRSPTGLYVSAGIIGIGMALQYPALMAMAVNRATEAERSSVVGSFTAFFDLAFGLGGFVLGAVVSIGGYRAGFAAGSVCAVMALLLLRLRVARGGTREPGEAETHVLDEPDAWLQPGVE